MDVPGDCTPYVNTATIDQPIGADPSASAAVQACTPEVLPAQAFGQATGSVTAGCQGTVRARVSNRTGADRHLPPARGHAGCTGSW